jgi:hypothetical protein
MRRDRKETRWISANMIIVLGIVAIMFIFPVCADPSPGEFTYRGKILSESGDLIIPGAYATYYETKYTPVHYPWEGYSDEGWTVLSYGCVGTGPMNNIRIECNSGNSPFEFKRTVAGGTPYEMTINTPRYRYIHIIPPKGWVAVSARSLNSVGTVKVLDNRTIFFDAWDLPPLVYDVEFTVKPYYPCQNDLVGTTISCLEQEQQETPPSSDHDDSAYVHVRAPAAPDVRELNVTGLQKDKIITEQGSVSTPIMLPCENGSIRCGDTCVDYLNNRTNCGSCGNLCPSGNSCESGQCTFRKDISSDKPWYEPIILFPRAIISILQGTSAGPAGTPDTGGNPMAGSQDGSSLSSDHDSIQVVRIAESETYNMPFVMETSGPSQDIILQGTVTVSPAETPSQILPPDASIRVPATGIADQPVIVASLSPPCPNGYNRCSDSCVDLMSNYSHCGACNNICWPGTFCSDGLCIYPNCDPGRADCDHNSKNGCETDIASDPNYCGSCGNVCTNGGICTNGQCILRMATTQPTRLGELGKAHL